MEKKVSFQIVFSFGLLLLTEILYRSFPVEGFDQPFTPNRNFGTWLDMLYGGADLGGHWVSFNAIPTAAHTIWGVLAGKLLLSEKPAKEKIKILLIAGLAGVVIGYALQPVTPIIKRIATSSFVIVSGGWALLVMAFSYWLIDVKRSQKWVIYFAVVGMNPLFIYLFAHVGGSEFIRNIIRPFSNALFDWTGKPASVIIMNGIVWFLLWYITWWMYKKKLFIRI
jgi:predicted acyltransferase